MSAVNSIDTNVLVRFFVGDNVPQQLQARRWFQEAESGKRKIRISLLVVAETCYVLESVYQISRTKIAEVFGVLLSQKWLSVEDRDVLSLIWKWYLKNFHFVDSYLLAQSQRKDFSILSFDKQLLQKHRSMSS